MFIPANEIKVGDKCIAIKEIECLAGMFTVGTPVTVTDIGDRGYDLVDDFGNVITECGWNCIKKIEPELEGKNHIYIILEHGMVSEILAEKDDIEVTFIDLDTNTPDEAEASQKSLDVVKKLCDEGKLKTIL